MTEKRLLIIDDDPLVFAYIDQIATGAGFSSDFISDPEGLRTAIECGRYDAIILDLHIPKMDGIEVLRSLANNGCETPVVLASGSDPRVILTAERLGMTHGLWMAGNLQKPFGPQELRAALDRAMSIGSARKKTLLERGKAKPESDAPEKPTITAEKLHRALENHEITAFYQPKVDMKSGRLIGAEALARWNHPEHGIIQPDAFIPIAEKYGLIELLTDEVLHTVMRQMTRWNQAGFEFPVAVNLAAESLRNLDFPDKVSALLAEYDLSPERLAFEITETGAMEDPVRVMDVLSRLRLKGIELSIDDFGTGYSSMTELRRMPVGEIKVDKSFVLDLIEHNDSQVFVSSVIHLGHNLNLKVVAEGVENSEIWDLVNALGCDIAQGYHVSRPVDAEEFSDLVAGWNPKAVQ